MAEAYFPTLFRQMREAFVRFPLPLLMASITALAAAVIPWVVDSEPQLYPVANIVLVAGPLFLLLLSRAVAGEYRGSNAVQGRIVDLLFIAGGVGVYWLLPPWLPDISVIEAAVLFITMHGLVAVSPMLGGLTADDAWLFNWKMLIRLLTAALFSHILFGGIVLLTWTVSEIFKLDWPMSDLASTQYALVLGLFNSWFVCGGVPKRDELTNADSSGKRAVRIFTYYILLPLTLLSTVVSLLFFLRAVSDISFDLVEGLLPNDMHGSMVVVSSLFSAFLALLCVLLAYPAERDGDFGWSKMLTRIVLLLLVPAALIGGIHNVILVNAVGSQPGYYFLALVLLFACAGLLVSAVPALHARKVVIIPAGLVLAGLVAVYGPLSLESVVGGETKAELRAEFDKYRMLTEDGRLQFGDASVDREFVYKLTRSEKMYGYRWFQEFVDVDLDEAVGRLSQYGDPEAEERLTRRDSLLVLLHIPRSSISPYRPPAREKTARQRITLHPAESELEEFNYLNTSDFRYTLPLALGRKNSDRRDVLTGSSGSDTIEVLYKADLARIEVSRNNGKHIVLDFSTPDIRAAIRDSVDYNNSQPGDFVVTGSSDNLRAELHMYSFLGYGEIETDDNSVDQFLYRVDNMRGVLLLHW